MGEKTGMRRPARMRAFGIASMVWAALLMVAAALPAAAAPQNGWDEAGGERYWYDDGVMARDKQVYDPGTDAWYWFDADGTMARDKDVYIPLSNEDRSRGKWVRYDADGRMVKGEDFRYGGWYYFDPVTGEMLKGFTYVPSNGGKWVFYDYTTGQMAHGERYIDGSHGDEPGWMYFDDVTGAVLYGWQFMTTDPDGGLAATRWVYYHASTGRMVKGWHTIDGVARYFDETTGAYVFSGASSPSDAYAVLAYLNQARAAVGAEPLVWDEGLAEAAELRAAELTISFSHTRPDGTDCSVIFPEYWYGSYHSTGENIAAGYRSAYDVNQGWTESPGHYRNMINTRYHRIGIGCFIDASGYPYWVEAFSS
ncbi:MAG TPA: CAP domain-containing protein [Collinsella ihuae]|uniref:CAP domain-containing protein n=1 Tax=Collinsella ihumii TaxID=1720204 RepID=A0A921LPU1_9ACTN|nr:CAP domain-containing protein [Collinsella ihumii]